MDLPNSILAAAVAGESISTWNKRFTGRNEEAKVEEVHFLMPF